MSFFPLDLSNYSAVTELVSEMMERWGHYIKLILDLNHIIGY